LVLLAGDHWHHLSPPPPPTNYTKLKRLKNANPKQIKGIQVNPDSVGKEILPGNLVYRKYKSGQYSENSIETQIWLLLDDDGSSKNQ
jgi:hypothetical protein